MPIVQVFRCRGLFVKFNMSLKITEINTFQRDSEGKVSLKVSIGRGHPLRKIEFEILDDGDINSRLLAIISESNLFPKLVPEHVKGPLPHSIKGEPWIYKNKIFSVENPTNISEEEIILRIKHLTLKSEKDFKKMVREVEAFENLEKVKDIQRERIPENVRLFVWQRDEGKCIKCGSNEKLEFDHIIPVADGGSNTERNIQLLCESCNRSKGRSVL